MPVVIMGKDHIVNETEMWIISYVSAQSNIDDLIWAGMSSWPIKLQNQRTLLDR